MKAVKNLLKKRKERKENIQHAKLLEDKRIFQESMNLGQAFPYDVDLENTGNGGESGEIYVNFVENGNETKELFVEQDPVDDYLTGNGSLNNHKFLKWVKKKQ